MTQKLTIVLRRMPPKDTFADAILSLDEKVITKEMLVALIGCYPESSDLQELREENDNEPGASWDFPEDYFLSLMAKIPDYGSIKLKLDVWRTLLDLPEQL